MLQQEGRKEYSLFDPVTLIQDHKCTHSQTAILVGLLNICGSQ
jgi:hypothetical protein